MSISNKLFFDIGNTLTIFQRQVEKKTIQKSDFEIEILQRVTFSFKVFTTRQISKRKFLQRLDFELKIFCPVIF